MMHGEFMHELIGMFFVGAFFVAAIWLLNRFTYHK